MVKLTSDDREDRPFVRAVLTRITRLRNEREVSQKTLADRMDTTQSEITKLETGERRMTLGWLDIFASALDVPVAMLLGVQKPRTIQVRGLVGASNDDRIEFVDDGGAGIDEVEAPPDALGGFALEVRGRSMVPRFWDGEIVVCNRQTTDADAAQNRDCAVQLEDGRRLLKRVEPGSRRGRVTLVSFNQAFPVIPDVKVEWFAPVLWTRHLDRPRRP